MIPTEEEETKDTLLTKVQKKSLEVNLKKLDKNNNNKETTRKFTVTKTYIKRKKKNSVPE